MADDAERLCWRELARQYRDALSVLNDFMQTAAASNKIPAETAAEFGALLARVSDAAGRLWARGEAMLEQMAARLWPAERGR